MFPDNAKVKFSSKGRPHARYVFMGEEKILAGNDENGVSIVFNEKKLPHREGTILSASFYNGSGRPVFLKELVLLECDVKCSGVSNDWLQSTLPFDAKKIGSLDELLPGRNDGRWRVYMDFLTLYNRGGEGLCFGPAGVPEADLLFECKKENSGFLIRIVSRMNITVEPGQTRRAQDAVFLYGPCRDSLEYIMRGVAETHGSRTHRPPALGWCSWYDLGRNITEESVLQTIRVFAENKDRLKAAVIQIDDGWQKTVGDWRANDKFPRGMSYLASEIEKTGAVPGVWLAPLAVHESTGLLEQHPDWFQRDEAGELVGAHNGWGPRSRWLDPTHPSAAQFIQNVMKQLLDEGFRYFKVDFNTLKPECRFFDPHRTQLEVCRDLYRLYRETIGEDAYLLSCPEIRGAVGFADAGRVTPDSRAVWDSESDCIHECIRSVGMNAAAHKIFYSVDPDVYYLKPRKNPFGHGEINEDERRTWQGFVGLLGGLTLLSEPMGNPDIRDSYDRYEIMTPPSPERGMAFNMGADMEHEAFGFTARRNWGAFGSVLLWNHMDNPTAVEFPLSSLFVIGCEFHAWSFWDRSYRGVVKNKYLTGVLPPHGSELLRFTPLGDRPIVVGSTLHISMGAAELEDCYASSEGFTIILNGAGVKNGELYVFSPKPLFMTETVCCEAEAESAGPNLHVLRIHNRVKTEKQTIRCQTLY
jgi:hypothetical protein